MTTVDVRGLYEEFPFPYGGNHSDLLDRYIFPNVPLAPKLILDAGCGTGNLACEIAKHYGSARVTGLDFSNASLERARELLKSAQLTNLEFQHQDLMQPIAGKAGETRYDLVFNIGVLMVTPDPLLCLKNLRRVITDDGLFVILLYGKHGRIEIELERDLVDHLRHTTHKSNRELLALHRQITAEPELQRNRFRKMAPIGPRLLWDLLVNRLRARGGRPVSERELNAGEADQYIHPLVHNWTSKHWVETIESAGFRLERFFYDPAPDGWCVPRDPLSHVSSPSLRSVLAAMSPVDQYEAFDLVFRPMLHVIAFRPV
jgi:SAM-dependent methyltransferase